MIIAGTTPPNPADLLAESRLPDLLGRLGSMFKIVIIDGDSPAAAVITGSYNFTHAAQAKNAENVVVLSGNRALTDRFVENFARQRNRSDPWPSTSTSRP